MKKLSVNWFTEGTIDFEYKQYILLAYLQHIQQHFAQEMLYPALADVIFHYRNLKRYQEIKQELQTRFPQQLKEFDLANLQILYEQNHVDSDLIQELDTIVAYSLDQCRLTIESGREIYDTVDADLEILPVGLVPLYKDEGYVLLRLGGHPTTEVYQYAFSTFRQGDETMHGIQTTYVTRFDLGLTNTYTQMKLQLIRHKRELPNPATFVVETPRRWPVAETVLPVAKRRLVGLLAEKAPPA